MRYVLIVLAALLPGLVRAADAHAAPAGHAPVAAPVPAAPATLAAASAPSKAPPRKGFEDPMDRLRERLAAKLSAGSTADVSAPGVVKVVNHGVAPAPEAAAATAALATAPAAAGHGAAPPAPPRAVRAPAAAPAHVGHDIHWDYQGPGGPSSWGQLKPEFATCATGTRQSPIDIRDGIRVQLDPVQFDYRPSSFRVIDNGHTVQVDVGGGNAIDVLGKRYELLQFHFHRPSEERIEGRQFDMVAHLVHKSADGRLAVVAVLLEQGRAHPIVQAVWNNLPLDKGEDVAARASLDLNALLPEDRRYYTYMGSLTTPPCSEGVLWMVMRQPVQLSSEQVGVFARLYPMNARPIQQAAGRLIKQGE